MPATDQPFVPELAKGKPEGPRQTPLRGNLTSILASSAKALQYVETLNSGGFI